MIFKNPTINEIRKLTKLNRIHTKYLSNIANYFVWFAIKLKVTPNQVTYFWVIGQFLSTLLLLTKNHHGMVTAIILYQLFLIIDLSDGKLHRYRLSRGFKPK